MTSLDLDVRDPYDLNDHVQVKFEDVLGEADGVHSLDLIWESANGFYDCFLSCCYGLFSLCCGMCVGVGCGINSGLSACRHVWCYFPCLRSCAVTGGSLERCFGNLLACCLEPTCEASGWLFSRVRIKKQSGPA